MLTSRQHNGCQYLNNLAAAGAATEALLPHKKYTTEGVNQHFREPNIILQSATCKTAMQRKVKGHSRRYHFVFPSWYWAFSFFLSFFSFGFVSGWSGDTQHLNHSPTDGLKRT